MSDTATRNTIKQMAEKIEVLAKEVQSRLSNDTDFMDAANELVRNNLTFVFTLGEVYALEQVGGGTKVKATKVGNYHNVRDNRGRFAKKI